MSSEVTELITALRNGELSLEQVAERFRTRRWPGRTRSEPGSYQELAAAAERDPEPDQPGSFDEVYAAYDRSEISREQFQALKAAALEGMDSGPAGRGD